MTGLFGRGCVSVFVFLMSGCQVEATLTGLGDAPSDPVNWLYQPLTELTALRGLDMAMDLNDGLHVSLVDDDELHYLSDAGDDWHRESIARAGGRTGQPAAIAVDESGTVEHAIWWGGRVSRVRGVSGDWETDAIHTFASSTYPFLSMANSQSGTHIGLRFGYQAWVLQETPDWTVQSIGMGNARWSAMAFDGDGVGHLVTVDHNLWSSGSAELDWETEMVIRHATFVDGLWREEAAVDSFVGGLNDHGWDPTGRPPSTSVGMALDGDGRVHLAYFFTADVSNPDAEWVLKYAHQTDDGWRFETADALSGFGYYVSLALDRSGRPHISYFNNVEGGVFYATNTDGDWRTESVEPMAESGPRAKIAVDSRDTVSIVYPSGQTLRLATLPND